MERQTEAEDRGQAAATRRAEQTNRAASNEALFNGVTPGDGQVVQGRSLDSGVQVRVMRETTLSREAERPTTAIGAQAMALTQAPDTPAHLAMEPTEIIQAPKGEKPPPNPEPRASASSKKEEKK